MEKYKEDLIEYLLTRKHKNRDLLNFTVLQTARLIIMLEHVKEQFECFQDFIVDLRQVNFNKTSTFPLKAADFTIFYTHQDLVTYTFKWVLDETGTGLLLNCIVKNHVHQMFDAELAQCFDTPPDWLTTCEFCFFENNLGNADDLTEDQLGEYIVEIFRRVTQHFPL